MVIYLKNGDKFKKTTKLLQKKSIHDELKKICWDKIMFFFPFAVLLKSFLILEKRHFFFSINETAGKHNEKKLPEIPSQNIIPLCSCAQFLYGRFSVNMHIYTQMFILTCLYSLANIGFCHSFQSFVSLIGRNSHVFAFLCLLEKLSFWSFVFLILWKFL